MVDRYESIIGWKYTGQEDIQRYLSDAARIASSTETFQRLASTPVRAGAFDFLSEQGRSGLTHTTLREYDDLARATLRLRDAELARAQALKLLSISDPASKRYNPQHPKFIGEWNYDDKGKRVSVNETGSLIARERVDNTTLRAVDLAAKAQQQAFDDIHKREIAEAERRVAGQARLDDWWHDRQYDQRSSQLAERAKQAAELNAMQRRDTARAIQGIGEQRKYNAVKPKYVDPDVTTKVGRLQDDVNMAASQLARAQTRQATIHAKVGSSAEERIRVDEQARAAERRLILAENKLAGEMSSRAYAQRRASSASGGGGFGQNFMTGFHGRGDRPYAEQIGQAFKFSVFYGTAYKMLFALTATLQATLQEGIEFQKAMTELKIASGASADAAAEMAEGLAAQATMAGAAPSQGVMIGARSLGLFGATESSGASQAEQERIAEISARVVSRMALGSKTDPMEIQTQIAAVANAFGGGAQGQIRAYDLDAYLGRRFGVMPGETIQSVAESGTVGQAAGFNQEEVFAIAAALQSRTGQTSSAVAGWMAQIFSRGGEGSLTALTGKHGIDQSADLATQIGELARIYENASNTERAEIAAGFGRGKVQNAAVVMLDEFDSIMREATSARTGATGEGDKIFELRMGDIGGQIQQTVAVMKAFASELGQSGLLDIVGGVIVAFRELVEAATSVLQLWNQLPGALKATVAGLAMLAVAGRTAALSTGASGLLARGGLISPSLAASTGVRAPVGSVVSGAGFAAAGRAALSIVGPVGLAIGGLLAIGALKQSADRMREAQESAEEALRSSGLTSDSTGSDYIASASELDMLAQQNRDATGGFTNAISFGQADNENIAMAERLEEEADRRRKLAALVDERAANISVDAPVIASWDAEGLSSSLDLITASGGTATERLDALVSTLHGTADAAVDAASALDPEEFAGRMATFIKDGVAGITKKAGKDSAIQHFADISAAGGQTEAVRTSVDYEVYTGNMNADSATPIFETKSLDEVYQASQTEIQQRLLKQLEQRNIDSLTDLKPETAGAIAESLVLTEDFDPALSAEDLADARKRMVLDIKKRLLAESKGWRTLLDKHRKLTAAEVVVVLEGLATEFDSTLDLLAESDLGGRVKNRRSYLKELNFTKGRASDEELPAVLATIGRVRAQLAEAEIAKIEQVRRVAQQNANSAAEVAAAGQRAMRGRIAAAVKNGNADTLTAALLASGEGAIAVARAAINDAMAIANAAIRVQAAMRAAAAEITNIGGMAGLLGISPETEAALADLDRLGELKDTLKNAVVGDGKNDDEGADVAGPEKFFEEPKKKSKEDKKAEREAARQEMLDLKNNLYLLSIDLSDPLAMAVAAVKDARRRLQSDVASGQSKGTVAASRVALRQAEIEKEATAFQQRLEAVQTAEELGRISHRKYISYLESERKRLGAIKHRTYQQQQQLDEIDRLMKDSAESMQGMWNFGDIKLPTPYQVKRQVESMRLDRATQLDGVSNRAVANSTIYIDGADTGKVRQIIAETLGRANATVTNKPRRR